MVHSKLRMKHDETTVNVEEKMTAVCVSVCFVSKSYDANNVVAHAIRTTNQQI